MARRAMEVADPMVLSAVTALAQAPGLSSKYQFIPTTTVIDLLEGEGWIPAKATQVAVRKAEMDGYQKHLIRFRQPGNQTLAKVGDIIPEVVMTNGHSGLDFFTFNAGLFRLACLNGLIVADSTFASLRVRHMGFDPNQVYNAIRQIVAKMPEIQDQIERYRAITLSQNERGVFAEAAALIKYDQDDIQSGKINIERMLAPKRYADARPDLWTTFNVLQEKLINGGRFATREAHSWRGNYRKSSKARGTQAISENVRINKALWHLTSEMAKMKMAAAA